MNGGVDDLSPECRLLVLPDERHVHVLVDVDFVNGIADFGRRHHAGGEGKADQVLVHRSGRQCAHPVGELLLRHRRGRPPGRSTPARCR